MAGTMRSGAASRFEGKTRWLKPQPAKAEVKEDLSASKLAAIERDIARADLASVLRRQPVCAVLPNMRVKHVFDELYIHIAHLRQTLKAEVDFLSNRWLFKYLTHILDDRMMDIIRRHPARYLGTPISLNLNVETLLSAHFAKFDAAILPAARVSIVIEVPVVDVFADMTAFLLARSEVQKLGYRVCLDGLTTASFTSINREKLGADLVKVQWNADAAKRSGQRGKPRDGRSRCKPPAPTASFSAAATIKAPSNTGRRSAFRCSRAATSTAS